MLTRQDMRELAVLTAVGAVLGLAHLGLRPALPVLAEPAAACTLDDAEAPGLAPPLAEAPAASMEPGEPMSPVSLPGGAP